MKITLRGLTTVNFYAWNLISTSQIMLSFGSATINTSWVSLIASLLQKVQRTLLEVLSCTGVDDLQATLDKLLSLGATLYQPIIDRSGGDGNFVPLR